MKRTKILLAGFLALVVFNGFLFAADSDFAAGSFAQLSASSADAGVLPAVDLEVLSSPVLLPGESRSARAVLPGRDLYPKVSDRGRVAAILKLIDDIYYGRPLPYSQDGVVFKNREGILPQQPMGFYREYTLIIPKNSPNVINIGGVNYQAGAPLGQRGAERIVIGGEQIVYYSPDHYRTFIELKVVK